MGRLEEEFLATAPKSPLIWLRYIDDVFLLWTHGEEQLDNFISYCNTRHRTIKFTAEKSKKSLRFLDVMVELRDGYLETDLYSKPTDTHQYLQWSSCHPRHTKESLPYSLAFRLRRICSTDGAFAIRIDQLKEYLSNRGLPCQCHPEADSEGQRHFQIRGSATSSISKEERRSCPSGYDL